ncbi:MAG TPA: hypothetical protein VNG13_13785 [Mycobacteriales bacterium]|nr:hypothetical protein [Mycobacteriales bacterium]
MVAASYVEAPERQRTAFGLVLRSELTKLRTVRSTYWSLVAAVFVTVVVGSLISFATVSHWDEVAFGFDAARRSLSGVLLAQLAFGVLGVLVITAEFSTGMIRSTFAAVPQRTAVLVAKAIVFAAVSFVVAALAVFPAFFIGQAIFHTKQAGVTLGDPGVFRAVIGGVLYLTVLGLFALGLGTMIRHTAGAIAALFGMLLVLPGVAAALPSPWDVDVSKFLPSDAGMAMFATHPRTHGFGADGLAPWTGFAVFCGWAALTLLLGAYLLNRRDA